MLGVAPDASFVYWLVLIGLSFSRPPRQLIFQEASIFIYSGLCACGTEVKGQCILIDRRRAERKETESRDLFTSYRRQAICFNRPGATFSAVRLFPAVLDSVNSGQLLVSLGCWQSQPSSTLSLSGKSEIGSLTRRFVENGVLGTTND